MFASRMITYAIMYLTLNEHRKAGFGNTQLSVFAGQAVGIKEMQDDIWLVRLALWIMIWATSIWRRECSNHSKTRLVRKCYPCSRYDVLPMFPGRTPDESGRGERI